MRVLYVANGFPPTALGGVEVSVYEIARSMARRGHEVWVFCRESDFDLPDYEILEEETEGIHIVRVVNDFIQRIQTFRRHLPGSAHRGPFRGLSGSDAARPCPYPSFDRAFSPPPSLRSRPWDPHGDDPA